jgi:uncharacterized protein (UPF0276 family)
MRADYPIAVHGVGLSLGAAEGIDSRHLARLAKLVDRVEPMLVSEHLAWTGLPTTGLYLNDLLPLPYTEEALAVISDNIDRAQDTLRRRILIENPSLYLAYAASAIPESEFLAELARRTGCGILCDVNNIHVSCTNLGGDPLAYLQALPADAVGEMHLAGHCVKDIDGTILLIDDHGSRMTSAVWALYERAVRLFPHTPTLIEWDTEIPDLAVLAAEADKADCRRISALEAHHALVG